MIEEIKKDKIRLLLYLIIIIEIVLLVGLSAYRINEFKTNKQEEINSNEENKNNIENEKEEDDNTNKEEQPKEQIKILVDQINIRQAANETSKDIGDVFIDEVFDILDIIDTTNYTWYEINKEGITGYVASKKSENWIEYNGTSDKVVKKVLYFYEQGGNLYVDEENKNKDYIGNYNCKSDNCYVHLSTPYGTMYDLNKKTVAISDNSNYYIFNYDKQNIVSDIYSHVSSLQNIIVATKNNKKIIIDLNGKEMSENYDNLFDWGLTPHRLAPPQNYSLAKKIVGYEKNGKEGLLSLNSYSEITEAKYDNISIYDDNIIATMNGLDYVMDSNGNIKSKGYKKVLSSNDKLIIVEENETIDIIDYSGNSKIKEKIPSNGHSYNRTNYYECIGPSCRPIDIQYNNNKLTIDVAFKNYDELFWGTDVKKRTKYIYDTETEILTKEEY